MKEAFVDKDTTVTIKNVPIPTPGPNQVLIKVSVSGSNPKDWKVPIGMNSNINQGDDISGGIWPPLPFRQYLKDTKTYSKC